MQVLRHSLQFKGSRGSSLGWGRRMVCGGKGRVSPRRRRVALAKSSTYATVASELEALVGSSVGVELDLCKWESYRVSSSAPSPAE